MSRSKRSTDNSLTADLPPFALMAAQRMGIDLTGMRGWALRPDGSVVLLTANGMKFVIAPE